MSHRPGPKTPASRRSTHVLTVVVLAACCVAGAMVSGSCHGKHGDTHFRSNTSRDLVGDYSTNPRVRMEPDVPDLRSVPVFFVNQEARKVIRLQQGMRVTFPSFVLGEGARLLAGAAVDPASWGKPTSATRLSILAGGEEVLVVELRPGERGEDRAWRDLPDLDLSRFRGRTVDLEMRAAGLGHPDDTSVLAGFANPLFLSNGTLLEGDDALIVLDTPQIDLVRDFRAEWATGAVVRTDGYDDLKANTVVVGKGDGKPLLEMPPDSRLSAMVTLPAGAALEVEFGALAKIARALHPDDVIPAEGDVEFIVSVAGREQLRERVSMTEAALQRLHSKRFRVAGLSNEPAPVVLQTSWADGRNGYAPLFWTRAALIRERTVARDVADSGKPNVIFVLVDTLRADHLGCYGSTRHTSPNVDRLASQGLLFRRCTAASSWTVPSTTTILTALPPLEHGAIAYDRARITEDVQHGAERFQARGFSTAAFVTNPWITRDGGYARGFDEFQELVGLRAEEVNRAFENWLDQNSQSRFFAYLHYFDPHQPYGAPGSWLNRFASPEVATRLGATVNSRVNAFNAALQQGQRLALTPEEIDLIRDRYDGEIGYFDECFGRLRDDLRARGILDRTVIVFTSDHGEAFCEHGFLGHEFDVSEETVHVPLVFWWPGRVAAGESDTPVGSEDVLPTLAALLDVPIAGCNVLANGAADRPVFTTTEQGIGELRDAESFKKRVRISAIRQGARKLWRIDLLEPLFRFFHLDSDPGEHTDVSGSEPDVERQMSQRLDEWLHRTAENQPRNRGFLDDELRRRLRALGYITGK
ncbi:MAG: sulfatase [Planctomycetes bacterium]|nr:sulfatase [Planctomycetota bacterium]MBI3847363.1 sulfatase [Planctomycetota bacterium]